MSKSPQDLVREEILALASYRVGDAGGMIKLDAMENPYSLPEGLRREIAELVAVAPINRYPDSQALALKARLRETMAVPQGCDILLGNGSDEIIHIIVQALARPGTAVLAPDPTFVMYRMDATYAGMRYVGVPLNADFSLDCARFVAAMQEHRPAVVFISYPNNPSGNLFPEADMLRIVRSAPGLVVVDEAYQPFAQTSFMGRLAEFPNLVVMRTVSKLGLAGLRLGFAAGRPEWLREFEKIRPPYNVGVVTQLVVERLLAHADVLDAQAAAIRAERARLAAELRRVPGVTAFPSDANFILIRVSDAARAHAGMQQRGVFVKNLHGSHALLAQCLRLTVGTPQENTQCLAALEASL